MSKISTYIIGILFSTAFIFIGNKIPINIKTSKYAEIFSDDYKDALNYFRNNKTLQKKVLYKNNVKLEIIIPIVFPERIRYSIVQDYFETKFLETIYTDYGSEYIDFSIGDFQMKPSFIEKLEKQIEIYPDLSKKYSLLKITQNQPTNQRKERVKRLKSTEYQLNYISLFYDIVNNKFDLSGMTKAGKIKFFASAYNFGFDKSKEEIIKHIDVKYFPYGTKYPGEQYAYTDVALDFYLNYYTSIFGI